MVSYVRCNGLRNVLRRRIGHIKGHLIQYLREYQMEQQPENATKFPLQGENFQVAHRRLECRPIDVVGETVIGEFELLEIRV